MPDRAPAAPAVPAVPSLQPTRDPRVTLDDLLEVVLNKGAVLHLDLIIAVADIPLIGVNVRAAIAGMETMLEYGMLRQWDEATRAWAERSGSRGLELRDGERLITRMFGGHRLTGEVYSGWRPGSVHLTDRRLVVLRREPREVLWEAELAELESAALETERAVGGEDRTRLRLRLRDGGEALLSAAEPERLHRELLEQTPGAKALAAADGGGGGTAGPAGKDGHEGHLWYHEPRRGGAMWRGGRGRLDAGGLSWKSPVDARPALVLAPGDLLGVRLEERDNPAGSPYTLVLDTPGGEVVLAADALPDWTGPLHRMAAGGTGQEDGESPERRRDDGGPHR
ncbi:gas vesicle protein [Streptomyces xinghaiensis]|uniref:gas vesicle protein n=1 Tax=Streptomyces xinghaiensis TaxID=1038928 RepID=UPI000BB0C3FF|nr:gas vesicle protein [Streptomyces xinghaiensis]